MQWKRRMRRYISILLVLGSLLVLGISCQSSGSKEVTGIATCKTKILALDSVSSGAGDDVTWALLFNPAECVNCYISLYLLYQSADALDLRHLHVVSVDMRTPERQQVQRQLTRGAPEGMTFSYVFDDALFNGLVDCIGSPATHVLLATPGSDRLLQMNFKRLDIKQLKQWSNASQAVSGISYREVPRAYHSRE